MSFTYFIADLHLSAEREDIIRYRADIGRADTGAIDPGPIGPLTYKISAHSKNIFDQV